MSKNKSKKAKAKKKARSSNANSSASSPTADTDAATSSTPSSDLLPLAKTISDDLSDKNINKTPDLAVGNAPDLAIAIGKVDNAIGFVEQLLLVLALAALISVGTYQFLAGRLWGDNPTWPFETLRYLVFTIAMYGAALSAQKGQMISMDFLSRKLTPKKRVLLRIATSLFVVFACYLLYKGGMHVRGAASSEEYELINPSLALLALPIGAVLIALHYILHSLSDAVYLSAGLLPPLEDGPQAH